MAQIKPLTAKLQKIAIEELGEVPERIPDDLQALKQWVQQQPHLKANTDDQFLIQFLRASKYNLERAKEKIDNFYTIKTKYPELFSITDIDDPKFREFHNTASTLALPKPLNECGPRICLIQIKYSTQEFSMIDVIRKCAAFAEVSMMDDPYISINGTYILIDLAHVTASHILQIRPSHMIRTVNYYKKALSLRVKAICIINLPAHAKQLVKMALTLAPEKLKQRVFICGKNSGDLSEHIPKKYLPIEYGGENGSMDEICAEYHKVWDEYREYFKQNANYGTDESLRLRSPLGLNDDLGVEGSFRRLEVD